MENFNNFNKILGNKKIINAMKKTIVKGNLSHAYIIDGEAGINSLDITLAFVSTILCENKCGCGICSHCKRIKSNNHPDIIFVEKKDKATIGVDIIRDEINSTVSIMPFESQYKIYIILNGNDLTVQSQNALLKTIETPPEFCIFIIITTNHNELLPTILSRCVLYKLSLLTGTEMEIYIKDQYTLADDEVSFYASYSFGNIGRAKNIIESQDFNAIRNNLTKILTALDNLDLNELFSLYDFFKENKDKMDIIFEIMLFWYRDVIIAKETKGKLIIQKDKKNVILRESEKFTIKNLLFKISSIKECQQRISRNANFQISIECLLLKLKEK
ncbi:MAG: ATP-binding protein [Lachnospirales bacterium]